MEEVLLILEEQGWTSSIALSHGGKFIAAGSYKGSIYLWNVLNLSKHYNIAVTLNQSPSGIGTVQVWDVTNDVT